jgi:hypothetical protein
MAKISLFSNLGAARFRALISEEDEGKEQEEIKIYGRIKTLAEPLRYP